MNVKNILIAWSMVVMGTACASAQAPRFRHLTVYGLGDVIYHCVSDEDSVEEGTVFCYRTTECDPGRTASLARPDDWPDACTEGEQGERDSR